MLVTNVPLTESDRETLRSNRPSFVWRKARRAHDDELAQPECTRYAGKVYRAWDLTQCSPGCCPNTYLLDVGDDRFLLVESSEHLEKVGGCFPGSEFDIRCSTLSGQVLAAQATGTPVPLETTSLRDIAPEPAREGCTILMTGDLPSAVRQAIGAVEQADAADEVRDA